MAKRNTLLFIVFFFWTIGLIYSINGAARPIPGCPFSGTDNQNFTGTDEKNEPVNAESSHSLSTDAGTINSEIPNETIKRVRNALNRIKPFKVDFVQEVYTDEEADIKESGEIIFKNDRQLKWTYLEPDFKVFLLEGENYQFYDEDNEQLIIGKVKDRSQQWLWQLLFSDSILRDYVVTWEAQAKAFHIKNNPQAAGAASDTVIDMDIFINDNALPIKVLQRDPSGARIVYFFNAYTPNIQLPANTFQLKVPDDVEIIRNES